MTYNVLHWRSTGALLLVLPGADDEKDCDFEVNEMLLGKSPAPNHSCHVADAEVTMSCPVFCQCFVVRWLTILVFDFKDGTCLSDF